MSNGILKLASLLASSMHAWMTSMSGQRVPCSIVVVAVVVVINNSIQPTPKLYGK